MLVAELIYDVVNYSPLMIWHDRSATTESVNRLV